MNHHLFAIFLLSHDSFLHNIFIHHSSGLSYQLQSSEVFAFENFLTEFVISLPSEQSLLSKNLPALIDKT